MRFWLGFFTVGAGTALILLSRKIFENFGRVAWAERVFGGAGTLTLIRLIGAALILFGLFVWTGLFDIIFGGLFDTLFGGVKEELQEAIE